MELAALVERQPIRRVLQVKQEAIGAGRFLRARDEELFRPEPLLRANQPASYPQTGTI